MQTLGIDFGSTTIKGAVLDLDSGEIHSLVRADFPPPIPGLPSGRFEVDPRAIQTATEQVLFELLRVAPAATSLYSAGQMGGTILVDPTGAALTNYLSWRDQRSLDLNDQGVSDLQAIRQQWDGQLLSQLGNELPAGSTACLLYWLKKRGQLPSAAAPATVADYVIGRLCGTAPQMHETHALGMRNLQSGDWHHEAYSRLGLEGIRWPTAADLSRPVGSFQHGLRTIACYPSVGDQQCALRGVGLTRDDLSVNVSTGSQVSLRRSQFESGEYQTRPYFNGDFLNTMTHLPAGRSLNVLVDLLTELARAEGVTLRHPWATISDLVAAVEETDLQVDLAFFAGPLGSRGSLREISTENLTIGHLFRAAFRSMADNYQLCADRLCPTRTWSRLVLSGGLTQTMPVLRKLLQDRFDVPIRDSLIGEETLAGLLDIARAIGC